MDKIRCGASRKLMAAALAGGMDDLKRKRFENHLAQCEACRRDFAQLRETWDMLEVPLPETSGNRKPLSLIQPRVAPWTSELAARVATTLIAAAIIFFLLLPLFLMLAKKSGSGDLFKEKEQTVALQTKNPAVR